MHGEHKVKIHIINVCADHKKRCSMWLLTVMIMWQIRTLFDQSKGNKTGCTLLSRATYNTMVSACDSEARVCKLLVLRYFQLSMGRLFILWKCMQLPLETYEPGLYWSCTSWNGFLPVSCMAYLHSMAYCLETQWIWVSGPSVLILCGTSGVLAIIKIWSHH
jgi:hypothetical protein